jgi:NADPH-dependent curcumin reductase CurA
MILDTPMRSFGLGQVVESNVAALPVGTIVQATLHWSEYIILDAKDCVTRTPPPNASITTYLGAFGGNGLTAYYGLVVIGEAKAGQRVVVSGAAGATGSMVVQIAKHVG